MYRGDTYKFPYIGTSLPQGSILEPFVYPTYSQDAQMQKNIKMAAFGHYITYFFKKGKLQSGLNIF